MAARKVITYALLAFILISIGYIIGSEVTLARKRANQADVIPVAVDQIEDAVIVYYMHGARRCVTCNTIETLAHETVQNEFVDELQSGRLQWRVVNYEEDADLARRYDVVSSGVVVVRTENGQDIAHERLDDVWRLVNAPDEFRAYVANAVRQFLPEDPTL